MWLELSTGIHCLPTWMYSRENGGEGRTGQAVRAGPHHECSCNLIMISSSLSVCFLECHLWMGDLLAGATSCGSQPCWWSFSRGYKSSISSWGPWGALSGLLTGSSYRGAGYPVGTQMHCCRLPSAGRGGLGGCVGWMVGGWVARASVSSCGPPLCPLLACGALPPVSVPPPVKIVLT